MLKSNQDRIDFQIGTAFKSECRNYCQSGIMSRCSAGTSWEEQHLCKYARKSTFGEWCMHYRKGFDDHCDCIRAQREKPGDRGGR